MTLDIKKILVLSTAHISCRTATVISDVVAGSNINYGWFCWAHDENSEGNIPDDLMKVFAFALRHDCDYVLLDQDGDTIDELEVFEW